jgi:hypothetical protein
MADEGFLARQWRYVATEWHVIWQAKRLFGTAGLLLIAGTALITWRVNAALDSSEIAGLNATITTLHATIDYQSARLEALAKSSPAGAVSQARMMFVKMERRDVDGKFGMNVYLQNTGNDAAIGAIHEEDAEIFDKPVTSDDLDRIFHTLKNKLLPKEKLGYTSEVQPNTSEFFTTFTPILGSEVDARITNGPDVLLYAALVEYRDHQTLPNQLRVTEICQLTVRGSADHNCNLHNRIYTYTPG